MLMKIWDTMFDNHYIQIHRDLNTNFRNMNNVTVRGIIFPRLSHYLYHENTTEYIPHVYLESEYDYIQYKLGFVLSALLGRSDRSSFRNRIITITLF